MRVSVLRLQECKLFRLLSRGLVVGSRMRAEQPIFPRFKTGYMGLDSPRLWMRLNLWVLVGFVGLAR